MIKGAKNGRNKPGDKLRNEAGMEWEISVWMDWEILRKWAKRPGHPWEPSVELTHECCVIRAEILIIFIQNDFLARPCQLLYSALRPPLEFMLSCFSMCCAGFKRTRIHSHRVNLPSWISGRGQIITHSQNTHWAHSTIKICCVWRTGIFLEVIWHKSRKRAVFPLL